MAERAKLKYKGVSYTDEQLLRIGNNVAMLWGAFCFGYRINRAEQKIYFECVEHGEKFLTTIDFDKMEDYMPKGGYRND